MTIPWPAGGTPYITSDQLTGGLWPVSVDWTTLPPGTNVTQTQKTAALAAVCMSATSQITGHLNFPLHAVLNTEQLQGPNYRVTVHNSTGEGRVILSRWPVTNIVSVQVAPAGVYTSAGQPQWTTVPAGNWRIEYPVIGHFLSNAPGGSGEGGQAILIAPSWINWCRGRWGVVVSVQYIHGWPHTHLTAPATSGTSTLTVGDCTAWAPFTSGQPGATGIIWDVTGGQEPVSVTASSVSTGAGTLTLSSATNYAHAAGVMVSALPADVIWAGALFAGAEALTRGAQSTTVQSMPGRAGGLSGKAEMKEHARCILKTFERTV